MKRVLVLIIAVLFAVNADAQSWLEKAGQRAIDRAKQKAEDKVNEKIDKTVDGVFDQAEDAVSGESSDGQNSDAEDRDTADARSIDDKPAAQTPKSLEAAYAKSDFVPGDEIIFADDLASEKSGEFPSQWDLLSGSVEISNINGSNAIYAESRSMIAPLMKDMKGYLPDVFTVEFDVTIDDQGQWGQYDLRFFDGDEKICEINWGTYGVRNLICDYKSASGDSRHSDIDVASAYKNGEWNHVAVSFNKRAMKFYLNGQRLINIPAMAVSKRLTLEFGPHGEPNAKQPFAIKDFRMAQGAVPLYNRMMTDGKIVSYGITFDVGKSTIKPESMTEINRIAQLMNDNPALKFSVEGHTDSTGNPASNQTLSDARSKAVMDKLIELGIAADRLKAAGKGQNNPIADNSTDEGRAKNRRVEFVKL